ncbi:MAG: peptidylprolyl isomerase [Victivallaceae bacterium]|nr:peptidylprolyl isomerase [Victivallaceae bacterium]
MSMKKISILAGTLAAVGFAAAQEPAPAAAAAPQPAQTQPEQQPEQQQITQAQLMEMLKNMPQPDFEKIAKLLPETVGTVMGEAVTRDQFIEMLKADRQLAMYLPQIPDDQLPQVLKQVAGELMRQKMLTKLAPAIDETQAAAFLREQFNAMPEAQRTEITAALKERGKSVDDYCTELAANPKAREGIAIASFFEKLYKENNVGTKEAAKAYYDANMKDTVLAASHILYAVEQNATPEQEKEAQDKAAAAIEKLKAGADFAEIAKGESACPSKANGGDLGVFEAGNMVPAFSEAVILAQPGDVVDHPVKTQFGYHVIRRNQVSFDAVAPEIEMKLKEEFAVNYLDKMAKENIVNNIQVPEPAPAPEAAPAAAEAPAAETAK